MGAFFTNFRLFFHNVFLIINTLFPTLHVNMYAGCVKLYAETSEICTHAVFYLVVARKTASSEIVLQGTKVMEGRDWREDEDLIQFPVWSKTYNSLSCCI